MKKIRHYLRNKWVIAAIIVLVLIIAIMFARGGGSRMNFEAETAKIGNIVQEVSVTGKVTPFNKADLSFEKGGLVSRINVKVGDTVFAGQTLGELEVGEIYASLKGAQANVFAEQARLEELQKGLRPEELSVENTKITNAETTYNNTVRDTVNVVRDANVKAQTAVQNYADTLFSEASTVNPQISIRTESDVIKRTVESQRLLAGEALVSWKRSIDALVVPTATTPGDDVVAHVASAQRSLSVVGSFLSTLSSITSVISTGNSGQTQAAVDAYRSTVNTALTTYNTAVTSLGTADSALRNAATNLNLAHSLFALKKAGSSMEEIKAQQARVVQAEATVANYSSSLQKSKIVVPITGTVSVVLPKIGEIVSPGQKAFSVISDDSFKIEVNVPEADIAKVAIGNKAVITLDAYGDDVEFGATVFFIDPAETVIEGVSTYKVTLKFDAKDSRVRSGMTANIELATNSREGVVAIPFRAVIDKDGKKTVRVVSADGQTFIEKEVVTGLKGSDGKIEIKEGIVAGDSVVTFVK